MSKQIPLYDSSRGPMRLGIAMSGKGSNARKILEHYTALREAHTAPFIPSLIYTDNPESQARNIREEFQSPALSITLSVHPIKSFYSALGYPDQKNMAVRAAYDSRLLSSLRTHQIDCLALAGYDWAVTELIWDNALTVNVHPGDLREADAQGIKLFKGLGWIPSAKAILAGRTEVYTTVHLVARDIDKGAILAVSNPQYIPDGARWASEADKRRLIGVADDLKGLIAYLKTHPEKEVIEQSPLLKHAKGLQELLKIHGDWEIFPKVIEDIARGRFSLDVTVREMARGIPARVFYDGSPVSV